MEPSASDRVLPPTLSLSKGENIWQKISSVSAIRYSELTEHFESGRDRDSEFFDT